jgi:hypothetical protein
MRKKYYLIILFKIIKILYIAKYYPFLFVVAGPPLTPPIFGPKPELFSFGIYLIVEEYPGPDPPGHPAHFPYAFSCLSTTV